MTLSIIHTEWDQGIVAPNLAALSITLQQHPRTAPECPIGLPIASISRTGQSSHLNYELLQKESAFKESAFPVAPLAQLVRGDGSRKVPGSSP
uniref:Uncharacterized protein n=1 Tax=Romanomermis culicivorax TaxID=13658 RepID=A0A915IRB4_ROMCU